ncbi:MAG: hypothetical protein ACRD8W_20385 [Nitrososphaeraceae archaeon]
MPIVDELDSRRLIIGSALDDAAIDHNQLNWIGVSVSRSLPKVVGNMNTITNSATWYDNIPLKNGSYRGMVLNWPSFDANQKCYTILQSERQQSGIRAVKYDNTFDFYHSTIT